VGGGSPGGGTKRGPKLPETSEASWVEIRMRGGEEGMGQTRQGNLGGV